MKLKRMAALFTAAIVMIGITIPVYAVEGDVTSTPPTVTEGTKETVPEVTPTRGDTTRGDTTRGYSTRGDTTRGYTTRGDSSDRSLSVACSAGYAADTRCNRCICG